MIEESNRIHEAMIAKFVEMPCVSLAIDAGTIERRHFLDFVVLASEMKIKPFLDDASEKATDTAEDSRNFVTAAIRQLYQKNINFRSIVRNNLPAQVTALA
jgi:hypothetical protein